VLFPSLFFPVFRLSQQSCKLKFVNPKVCSVKDYERRMQMRKKSQKDMYGFVRPTSYLVLERQFRTTRVGIAAQLDVDWVEYLKAIGGPSNLKPYGTFSPSDPLRALVRRGVPVALRPMIWTYLSRTDKYRRRYQESYYSDLLRRIETDLEKTIKEDIEKDLER
jgi:hypothetical protein